MLQRRLVQLAGAEPMPQGDRPLDFGQPPAPDGLRFATPVDQGLEVAFQVGLAQRASLGRDCESSKARCRMRL